MSWFTPIITGVSFVWHLFTLWLSVIFVAPIKESEMLWVLIPIYLGWITAELFQEKRGTSLGNAISNAVIPFWAGIDWMRTTASAMRDGIPFTALDIVSRYFFAAAVLLYGLWIVWAGAKGDYHIKRYGRIRIVTYIVILFTPVYYRAVPLDWSFLLATALYFPLFYYIVEGVDRLIPDPKSIIEERQTPTASHPPTAQPVEYASRPAGPQNSWPPRTP